MHGKGRLSYPNGDYFLGVWSGGVFQGQGRISFPNGDV